MEIRLSATLFIVTAVGALTLSTAAAQSPRMRGALSGFVFDPDARGVRPLLGIPGAATMGDPLLAGVDLQNAAVSPDGDYALAITNDGRGLLAILQLSGNTSVRALGAETAAGDTIELSPLGTYAVLYHHATQSLQVVKGLPGAPSLGQRMDVARHGGPLSAFAINDQGTVLMAAPAGQVGQVYVFASDGEPHLISTVRHTADLAFINATDAVLADDRHNEVYLLRSVTGVTATLPLAREAQGLAHPQSVAVSRDQRTVYVANAGSADIIAINLSDGVTARYACPCAPSAVRRLNGTAVFRLTEPDDGPLWLFDGDSAQPRIVFVPASKAKQ
ncbi:MAG: hypothetical protein HYX25_05285 [Candidatus Solibacter usitatus]|nr:hypothetical protein [Candidatus Solibacter usitatus]